MQTRDSYASCARPMWSMNRHQRFVKSRDNGAEAEAIRERGCSSWLSHHNQLAVEIMISLVIPVYNEAENIPELYNRITTAAAQWGDEYEVVSVDDGSSDASLQQLAMIHQR